MRTESKGRKKARIEFAPDGLHYQKVKDGKIGRMWDYFVSSPDLRELLALNPQAKFRLIGETGIVIGVLPKGEA